MSTSKQATPAQPVSELLDQVHARAVGNRWVTKVLETVQNNLAHAHTLEALARVVNLSSSRLRLVFKHATGMTLTRYIRLLRIERVSQLLTAEFLTIKVAIERVGINDQYRFVREFKGLYGATPGRYRNYAPGKQDCQSR